MPGIVDASKLRKKRKRIDVEGERPGRLEKASRIIVNGSKDEVKLLERRIHESQKHYNDIVKLISIARDEQAAQKATIALCRVFSRLIADGRLSMSKHAPEAEQTVVGWLRERFNEYRAILTSQLCSEEFERQTAALTLYMQLVKQELVSTKANHDSIWRKGTFSKFMSTMLAHADNTSLCFQFVKDYTQTYDDVRHYTFIAVSKALSSEPTSEIISNTTFILSNLDPLDPTRKSLDFEYNTACENHISLTTHRRAAQAAWLALLSQPLPTHHRATILSILVPRTLPWLSQPIRLLDFLTDSFDTTDSTSSIPLLALSGLFTLITAPYNLDYPTFYPKLYSLLQPSLLYTPHTSRFLRHLDTFLASTHLPATLVASFLKRLARLALSAPPHFIVAIIPLTYNLLQTHPACTFMLHRVARNVDEADEQAHDAFDAREPDPMQTRAIESSLWELETLRAHYHPNVASLAGIMAEQFTKKRYNFEDFLDHSYAGLIEAELGKELKKVPIVEFEIPKRIFGNEEGDDGLEGLMLEIMQEN